MINVDELITDEENLVREIGYQRPTCSSCIHWSPYYGVMKKIIEKTSHRTYQLSSEGSGKCLRLPPTSVDGEWTQPDTLSGDSCGEWKIREFKGKRTQLNV